ncbi:MAG: 50S ribosomal protein L15 [Sphingomonadales bacterium]
MKLNELSDVAGAKTARTRVGRGQGSGKGRTAGRGMNGQKSRSGVAIKGFEGGQMPIHRRLPKRGFTNIFRKSWTVANLGRIQKAIDDNKLNASKPVTASALVAAGVIGSEKYNLKLLAKGDLKTKINIEVYAASSAAIAAVEAAGGKVTVTHDASAEIARKAAKAEKRGVKKAKSAKKAAAKKEEAKKEEAKKDVAKTAGGGEKPAEAAQEKGAEKPAVDAKETPAEKPAEAKNEAKNEAKAEEAKDDASKE